MNDSYFSSVYEEEYLKDCEKYVNDKARSYLNSKNGAIEDKIVFAWIEEFYTEEKEKVKQKNEETKKFKETEEKRKLMIENAESYCKKIIATDPVFSSVYDVLRIKELKEYLALSFKKSVKENIEITEESLIFNIRNFFTVQLPKIKQKEENEKQQKEWEKIRKTFNENKPKQKEVTKEELDRYRKAEQLSLFDC